MFIGPRSFAFDAQSKKSNVFYGAFDGVKRREINDSQSHIIVNLNQLYAEKLSKSHNQKSWPLNKIIHHPELFSAYPVIAEMVLNIKSPDGSSGGGFDPSTMEFSVNLRDGPGPWETEYLKSILHEVQHVIQLIEGFDQGSSYDVILKSMLAQDQAKSGLPPDGAVNAKSLEAIKDQAFLAYYCTSGEIEARDVEERLHMSPWERQTIAPYSSYEFSAEQVVRPGPLTTFRENDDVSAKIIRTHQVLLLAKQRVKSFFGMQMSVDSTSDGNINSHAERQRERG